MWRTAFTLCVYTALRGQNTAFGFVAKTLPKTLPLACVSALLFVAKALPLPCVSSDSLAKTLPLACVFPLRRSWPRQRHCLVCPHHLGFQNTLRLACLHCRSWLRGTAFALCVPTTFRCQNTAFGLRVCTALRG